MRNHFTVVKNSQKDPLSTLAVFVSDIVRDNPRYNSDMQLLIHNKNNTTAATDAANDLYYNVSLLFIWPFVITGCSSNLI